MRRLVGLSAAGLIASAGLAVYVVASSAPLLPEWPGGVLAVASVVALVVLVYKIRSSGGADRRRTVPLLIQALPTWAKCAVIAFIVAAGINFLTSAGAGAAGRTPDGYAIENHGAFVRAISHDEYLGLLRLERRNLLSVPILLYALVVAGGVAWSRREQGWQR